jgi:hypothetical protein
MIKQAVYGPTGCRGGDAAEAEDEYTDFVGPSVTNYLQRSVSDVL